ncbi:hypothetical protein [Paenibacillus sp. DR312]|uniref:hypothetical protein n=1 Tax=Paenibacillus sp. DR312 TaxID=2871175 RepID=UPI001C9374C4|nr:hypothetical protein [Paenibacillus sp. DR312]QZN75517.1 hypothetical protein K5K90_29880 [Paenibacillus sp. DR312]
MDYRVLKEFIDNGSYREMKEVEYKLKVMKDSIRAYQENSNRKRMEWKKYGVVGKFIGFKRYSTDLQSIYEILENHGVIHLVLKVKWTKLTTEEQKKLFKFVVPSPPHLRFVHTCSKNSNEILIPQDIIQLNIDDCVREWKDLKCFFDRKIIQWNSIKKLTLVEMMRRHDTNVNFSFGKAAIIKTSPKISTTVVYKECGAQVIKNVGHIDHNKLIEYIAKGFVRKSEVNQFQKLIGIDLRYYLMEIRKEENSRQVIQNEKNHLSELSRMTYE